MPFLATLGPEAAALRMIALLVLGAPLVMVPSLLLMLLWTWRRKRRVKPERNSKMKETP